MSLLEPLRGMMASRSAAERRRLAILLPFCVLLLGYWLFTRLGDGDAESPVQESIISDNLIAMLPVIERLTESNWRQAAESRGIALIDIRRIDNVWQLHGQSAEPAAWQALASWAAERGWWATGWHLTRKADDSFVFEARFVASLEKEKGNVPEPAS